MEDAYMVSNLGRVKSLNRVIYYTNGKIIQKKEKIMPPGLFKSPQLPRKGFKRSDQYHVVYRRCSRNIFRQELVYRFVDTHRSKGPQLYHFMQRMESDWTCIIRISRGQHAQSSSKGYILKIEVIPVFLTLIWERLPLRLQKRVRQVTQYDVNGRKLNVYESIKAAAAATGCKPL